MIAASLCIMVGLFAQKDADFDAPTAVQLPMEVWELHPQEVLPRRSIAPGVVHHYLIEATEGDRIEGVAAQYGVDIQLRLWGPNREKWKTFDFHVNGLEVFRHRAKNHGSYLLEVTSLNNTAGEYEIYLAMAEKEADALPDLAQQVLNLLPPNQPGMAFCVIQKGEIQFLGARGLVDVENNIPMDLHVPFHLRELSFPMYAHAFLELEQQGLVDLETPLSEILPWFPDYEVEIRLYDLISLRSGLPDCLPLMNWIDGTKRTDYSREEFIALLSMRQAWRASGEWRQSPSPTDEFLIQEALCAITGRDLASSMHSLLFEPLGMEDSRIEAVEHYPLSGDYLWDLGEEAWQTLWPQPPAMPFLTSSTQDVATWLKSLTAPSSKLAGRWEQLREWQLPRDEEWKFRMRFQISPEGESILFVRSSTREGRAFYMSSDEWGSLFEGWPLQKPGKAAGGKYGGRNHLRYPKEKVLAPFCGEYQCDQGDLRITISRGERHLNISDGRDIQHKLLVALDRESLFIEELTALGSLVFGELEGERYEEFMVHLRGSGRATFHRVEPEAPEDE